eukprot:m.172174 g.172174  ORF g.172174 m.172174 type:complete len:64 (-) comp31672_c2_seq1:90-281(-)
MISDRKSQKKQKYKTTNNTLLLGCAQKNNTQNQKTQYPQKGDKDMKEREGNFNLEFQQRPELI